MVQQCNLMTLLCYILQNPELSFIIKCVFFGIYIVFPFDVSEILPNFALEK